MGQITLFLALFVPLFLSGCASTPDADSVSTARLDLPKAYEILNVPFVEQAQNFCGPAGLMMVARFYDQIVSMDELGSMMFTPGRSGTLQSDMIGAARRMGMIALPIDHFRKVFTEVSENHPVIVLQNLGSSANPLWHYSVITGYDLTQKSITLHTGKYKNLKMELSAFERTWKDAFYWALLVVPPDQLPRTASMSEILNAVSALERTHQYKNAITGYQSILKVEPNQVSALFGLGNTYASMNEWKQAAEAFEAAALLEPQSKAIWTNLGEIYHQMKKFKLEKNALIKKNKLND
jgi:tetratricopeptide (TPR) repeat protein